MKNKTKNTNMVEIIADTLIESANLEINIREDLISIGEIASLECKKHKNLNKCIIQKMSEYINKEKQQVHVSSLLGQMKDLGDKYIAFKNAFNNMPEDIRALTLEAFLNDTHIDLESLEIIKETLVANLEFEDEEMAKQANIAILEKKAEIEKIEKCRVRCKKAYK